MTQQINLFPPSADINEKIFKPNVIIFVFSERNVDVLLQDGGYAYIYHNEKFIALRVYKDKIKTPIKRYERLMENLSTSETYSENYKNKQFVSEKIVLDAIDWLSYPYKKKFNIIQISTIKLFNNHKLTNIVNDFVYLKLKS